MSEWATLRRHGPVGMITLRADLATPALPTRIEGALGLAVPGTRAVVAAGAKTLLWMSPDELLLVLPPSEVTQTLGALADALKNDHHLAVDVSDARAMFHLGGPGAREVLAKLAPVDLHPDHFGRGEVRRSRLGQIAAAFWIDSDGFRVICFRSVADYAEGLLGASIDGGPVGVFSGT